MHTLEMSEAISLNRRRFLGTAAITVAAARLGMTGFADTQSSNAKPTDAPTIKRGTNTSFGLLKQIDAGVLSVGYARSPAPPKDLR